MRLSDRVPRHQSRTTGAQHSVDLVHDNATGCYSASPRAVIWSGSMILPTAQWGICRRPPHTADRTSRVRTSCAVLIRLYGPWTCCLQRSIFRKKTLATRHTSAWTYGALSRGAQRNRRSSRSGSPEARRQRRCRPEVAHPIDVIRLGRDGLYRRDV